jgi:hypothetical protein
MTTMRFSATEIIQQMADAYANCATFRDSGHIVSDLIYETPAPHTTTNTYPFSIWVARPDLFRLDLGADADAPGPSGRAEIILSSAGRTRTWSGRSPAAQEPASLDAALNSRAAAINLAGLIHPRIEAQEFIDGHSCYRITGKERTENVTVWIGVHSFLLHRILKIDTRVLPILTRLIIRAQEERIAAARTTNPGAIAAMRADIDPWRGATGRVETTVYYHPQRDVPIGREVFEPPGSA